jgi:anion-transporting  ArsA/GET3 family ATPase
VCTPTFEAFPGTLQAEHFAALKDELRATLDKMEAHEKLVHERQQPQTVEQVDQAEKKLSEALEALKQRRAELQKRKG